MSPYELPFRLVRILVLGALIGLVCHVVMHLVVGEEPGLRSATVSSDQVSTRPLMTPQKTRPSSPGPVRRYR